jgi:hypothetical protein
MIMTAKVDIHVRHPAHVPEANYPPSLVLLAFRSSSAAVSGVAHLVQGLLKRTRILGGDSAISLAAPQHCLRGNSREAELFTGF